ncbi:hypothetical protein AYI70_g2764 [Smittium culicis]|uniref:Uncharacterized protein n=1 Tax=Smittium culicis TaxID=133412 RepID=A0A1R1Y734_9FUNG|nr:hypothetical protein AYI70_g2764 [Smittium culicis]
MKQESKEVLQLVLRPKSLGTECLSIQFAGIEQPLQFPFMEFNHECNAEIPDRTGNYDSHYTLLEDCNLVSRRLSAFNSTVNNSRATPIIPDPKSGKTSLMENKKW